MIGACMLFVFLSLITLVQKSSGSDFTEAGSYARRLLTTDAPQGRNDYLCWVQLSDLHISSHYPHRLSDLKKYAAQFLRIVKPSVVLLSGDLTDAKNKERTCTRQEPVSWEQYSDLLETFSTASGLPLSHFLDVRGNHDTYEVPLRGGPSDFFSHHSATARKNHTVAVAGGVQSLTVQTSAGREHLFIGVDIAPRVGLRGPLNFVARATPDDIADLEITLRSSTLNISSTLESAQPSGPVKVVFGHYPLSFTWGGRAVREALLRGTATVFLNGHLHRQFGKRLYRYHKPQEDGGGDGAAGRGFWEWEAGDWRESRVVRVMVSDHGLISFANFEFPLEKGASGKALRVDQSIDPGAIGVVLVTSPTDARLGRANVEPLVRPGGAGTAPQIRAFVFWDTQIAQVEAVVSDRGTSAPLDASVEKIQLAASGGSAGPLFAADWDPSRYMGAPADRYWISVSAVSSSGQRISSEPRPFSPSGGVAPLRLTWKEGLAMGVQWEEVYPFGLWGFFWGVFVAILLIPAAWGWRRKQAGDYEVWALRRISSSSNAVGSNCSGSNKKRSRGRRALAHVGCCHTVLRQAPAVLLWALAESSMYRPAWIAQVAFFVYLALFPWFWGRMLGDGQPLASMSVWGVNTVLRDRGTARSSSGLAQPDTFILVVPFLVTAVLPTMLWIVAFNAWRSWRALRRCGGAPAYAPLSTGEVEVEEDQEQRGEGVRAEGGGAGCTVGSSERGRSSSCGAAVLGGPHAGACGLSPLPASSSPSPDSSKPWGATTGSSERELAEDKRGNGGWGRGLGSPCGAALAVTGTLVLLRVVRMVRSLAGAYGIVAIVISPGYSWLLLLPIVAMCCRAPPHPKCC